MTGLRKGSVFKSITYDEGETFYTIILKRRLFLSKYCKTITLYKNWEDDSSKLETSVRNYDSKDYSNEVRQGSIKSCDEEEIQQLKAYIKDLPPKIQRKIDCEERIKLSSTTNDDYRYAFEMQNISRLEGVSKDMSNRINYKKKISVI